MAYLLPTYAEDDADYTSDDWMLENGPFGVSGFCMDGVEVGNPCYLCCLEFSSKSESTAHFESKRHRKKVSSIRTRDDQVVDTSNGGDDPENLFLPNHCKVCDASLATVEQQSIHYMSERHQKKVRNYFLSKVGISESKNSAYEERKRLKYCSLCDIVLTSPIIAQTHYDGKKHAKKVRAQIANEASSMNMTQEEASESIRKQKLEIEMKLQEEDAKRSILARQLEALQSLEGMQ